jgi:hypothetical protein
MRTFAPMMQNGPISADSAIFAPFATIAVS